MSKNNFSVDHWFLTDEEKQSLQADLHKKFKSPEEILAPFYPEKKSTPNTLVRQYFVPGWQGDSLISKSVKSFRQLLRGLQKDAAKNLRHQKNFPKKLIQQFYEEFLSFSEHQSFNCTQLDEQELFWLHLKDEDSEYRKELDRFIEILSFRIAVIFLFKSRFIITLNKQTKTPIKLKDIIYPLSFLSKFFKSASSTELKSKAFEQNIYSWYRPSEDFQTRLQDYCHYCSELTITDIIKTISIYSEEILKYNTEYSHSVSHKQFGLFLNNLLINFPIWLDSIRGRTSKKFKTLNNLEVISCKYQGNHLESLSLSHWLAQESNKHEKWEQILCPDFMGHDFGTGKYLNIINELQFLNFLADIAFEQGWDPKQYVSHVTNSHLNNRKENNDNLQPHFSQIGSTEGSLTYDRVIMNLTNLPKNNPHHYVFTQLNREIQELKHDGFAYLITSKKLFIPSQKNKVETLLEKFRLEGVINLEDIKGKGEIGNYLYILRKKNAFEPLAPEKTKNTCYNFRLSAELTSFQSFESLTRLIQGFYLDNFKDLPPLYQKHINGFRLEFFQDAIANGQLIHSTSKDTKNITHPHFFERLMKNCQPLDYFFEIRAVDFEEENKVEEDTLFNFSNSFKKETAEYTIVVDKREKSDIKIEMIETNTLEAVSYDYGHALCSYFYIFPKWNGLCFKTISEFFQSNIGKQIVHLTFSNEIRKTKGNLSKILLPIFFSKTKKLPEHIHHGLAFLKTPGQELLTIHPTELNQNYQQTLSFLKNLCVDYPAHSLELLVSFRKAVNKCLEIVGRSQQKSSVIFANPLFKTPLLLSKKYNIYPDNKDVYIEFNSGQLEDIHLPLTKVKKIKGDDNHKLELFSRDKKIVTLYSEDKMISFLEFIVASLTEYPVSKIIQSVQAPSLDDLNSIFESYSSQLSAFNNLQQSISEDFDQILNTSIFSGK